MIESKPLSGTSIELPSTISGTQMGTDWTAAKINEMRLSTDTNIKNLGNTLFQNQTKIEKYVLTIDKDLKQVIIIRLDNFQ